MDGKMQVQVFQSEFQQRQIYKPRSLFTGYRVVATRDRIKKDMMMLL